MHGARVGVERVALGAPHRVAVVDRRPAEHLAQRVGPAPRGRAPGPRAAGWIGSASSAASTPAALALAVGGVQPSPSRQVPLVAAEVEVRVGKLGVGAPAVAGEALDLTPAIGRHGFVAGAKV